MNSNTKIECKKAIKAPDTKYFISWLGGQWGNPAQKFSAVIRFWSQEKNKSGGQFSGSLGTPSSSLE